MSKIGVGGYIIKNMRGGQEYVLGICPIEVNTNRRRSRLSNMRMHTVRGQTGSLGILPVVYHQIGFGGVNGEHPWIDPSKMPESEEFTLKIGDPYTDWEGKIRIHGATDGTHEDG
jgi:hypothetical protein